MNRMFRVATRALSLGLISILSLVIVVVANGIPTETLVAFRDMHDEARQAAQSKGSDRSGPPEFYAQAESDARLDAPNGLRGALNGPQKSTVNAQRLPNSRSPSGSDSSVLTGADAAEQPSVAGMPRTGKKQETGPAFELPPPPEDEGQPAESVELAQADPPQKTRNSGRNTLPPPSESKFVEQLTALQEQLNKIAAAQEQNQLSQQSWLESHQLLHERQLQQKLAGIEAGLKELKTVSDQLSATIKTPDSTAPRGYIVRQDKITTSPAGLETHPAVVRDVLQSLGDKSNLNLSLSINVEGDVEMNLANSASAEALDTVHKLPGYLLEKNGQKIHIPPGEPQLHQRDAYLPPVVK